MRIELYKIVSGENKLKGRNFDKRNKSLSFYFTQLRTMSEQLKESNGTIHFTGTNLNILKKPLMRTKDCEKK